MPHSEVLKGFVWKFNFFFFDLKMMRLENTQPDLGQFCSSSGLRRPFSKFQTQPKSGSWPARELENLNPNMLLGSGGKLGIFWMANMSQGVPWSNVKLKSPNCKTSGAANRFGMFWVPNKTVKLLSVSPMVRQTCTFSSWFGLLALVLVLEQTDLLSHWGQVKKPGWFQHTFLGHGSAFSSHIDHHWKYPGLVHYIRQRSGGADRLPTIQHLQVVDTTIPL